MKKYVKKAVSKGKKVRKARSRRAIGRQLRK